jgi:hypothetical protein
MDKFLIHPLVPVPKVLLPAVVGATAILANWIATGTFDRTEIAALVTLTIYTVIGYAVPNKALRVYPKAKEGK